MKKQKRVFEEQTHETDESVLEINPLKLDEDWMGQAKLYFKYAKELAGTRRDLDIAKGEVDLVKAEVENDIRSKPKRYGLGDKPTNPAVEAKVLADDRYQSALSRVIDCKHEVDVLQGFVRAIDTRKKALESMVDLHGQNYFATPRTKNLSREEMEEVQDRLAHKRTQRRRDKEEDEDE